MFAKQEKESLKPFHPASYRQVFKILDGMEKDWTDEQKLAKEKIKANMEKSKRSGEFLGLLLWKCKLHNGPLPSVSQMEDLATLLASDAVSNEGNDVLFDSEDQIMSILRDKEAVPVDESSARKFQYQDPVIVLWHNRNGSLTWYLGFYLDDNDDAVA